MLQEIITKKLKEKQIVNEMIDFFGLHIVNSNSYFSKVTSLVIKFGTLATKSVFKYLGKILISCKCVALAFQHVTFW